MHGIWSAALLSAGMVVGAASIASAEPIERSGNVYHVAVCSRLIASGTARCYAHVVTDRVGNLVETNVIGNTTPRGYGPSDLRSAYKITASGSSSTIIALVDAFGYDAAEADLGVYRAQYGLPPCTTANGCFTKYNQKGRTKRYPAENVGWAQESALDLDMASAMCPNCKIILVEAKTNSFRNLGEAVNTAAAKGAHAISNSYGGGESGSQTFEADYNHAGVAVTASTGDSGYGAQFPATSPHVTAVGGTHLVTSGNARGWAETVWSGTGSGCSIFYAKPSWQTDSGCSLRMEADVSADADPATGVAVYAPTSTTHSAWLVFGGTSVAAPLVGGVYGANGGAVNYGSDPYANTAALFDVTSGSNGSCPGQPAYFCNAEVGYDGPTGLGTPNGVTAF
ncbi:MAG: S53 family peptidase [Caulobacteraceae bacterium]